MRLAPLLVPDVEEILRTDPAQVAELVEEMHVADLADVLGALTDEHAQRMLSALRIDSSASSFAIVKLPRRVEISRARRPVPASGFANRLSPDERADLFAELP